MICPERKKCMCFQCDKKECPHWTDEIPEAFRNPEIRHDVLELHMPSEIIAYREFMSNPENERNCSVCPENMGMSDWQDRLPCGQWNCWVRIHCGKGETV